MIKYLSDNITDFFYSNNIIKEGDKEKQENNFIRSVYFLFNWGGHV